MDRLVFTNGVFDLFHDGHRELLRQAAGMGVLLWVGVNSDASAKRLKGGSRPVHTLATRIENIRNFLDQIQITYIIDPFGEDTPEQLIRMCSPHILVHGSDAPHPWPGEEFVRGYGGEVVAVDRLPGISTTAIIERQS